jgi:hypothetical protein
MKTENDFNAYLSKQFMRFYPEYQALKISDRFHTGWSDFIITGYDKACFLECKRSKQDGSEKANILERPFTPPQIAFLRNSEISARAYGLVALEQSKKMILVPPKEIPENGNWKRQDFEHRYIHHGRLFPFDFSDVKLLLEHLVGEHA